MQYKNGGIDSSDKIACSRISSGWPEKWNYVENIKIIEKDLCRENLINESKCLTPMQVMEAVNNYVEEYDEYLDEHFFS